MKETLPAPGIGMKDMRQDKCRDRAPPAEEQRRKGRVTGGRKSSSTQTPPRYPGDKQMKRRVQEASEPRKHMQAMEK